ncbi:hypothetical protein N9Z79_05575, partial [Akkermansiaceae bacterium]|nr:hypothetical protein [Akkermansiaceae bacterium]
QYDGDEQVYLIPTAGGVPKQLTYYPAAGPLPPRWGYDHQVYGWTPDGKRVLFRSLRDADGLKTLTGLYTVGVDGGLPKMLPMPTAGAGDFSPDGRQLLYSPLFRDFRTWKRYEGGWAQDLYIFDLESNQATAIDNSVRTERDPMWIGDQLYFASDRGGRLNLYRYDRKSKTSEALTDHKEWDVRWPSSDQKSRVVFEIDGSLAIYDIQNNRETRLSISVPNDGLAMRPSRYPADKNIESYGLSPKGERALFVARGDIFTAPVEKGKTRNLTNSSNAHDKHARWSPDGAKIAFVSDLSGEEQLYLIDQNGRSGSPHDRTQSDVGCAGMVTRWRTPGLFRQGRQTLRAQSRFQGGGGDRGLTARRYQRLHVVHLQWSPRFHDEGIERLRSTPPLVGGRPAAATGDGPEF